jgi:hypothetical protein
MIYHEATSMTAIVKRRAVERLEYLWISKSLVMHTENVI